MRLFVAKSPFAVLAALAVLAGCAESVEGEPKTGKGAQTEEVADFDKPMEPAATTDKAYETPAADAALLGARQDLSFKGAANATCECLAVVVGQPSNPAFQWGGERPHTNRDTQLVIALTSAGIACPAAGANPTGASYWGYENAGNDVVVVVERAAPGRPIASGAIIPRPTGGGQVYVRPLDKKLPYGRPVSGGGDRCQIGTLPTMSAPAGSSAAPPSAATPSSGFAVHQDEPQATATAPKGEIKPRTDL